jgi:hypothetical protein
VVYPPPLLLLVNELGAGAGLGWGCVVGVQGGIAMAVEDQGYSRQGGAKEQTLCNKCVRYSVDPTERGEIISVSQWHGASPRVA